MEIKYTEEELNSIDKVLLIKMFLNLQNQMETLTGETRALNDKMQKMMEYMAPLSLHPRHSSCQVLSSSHEQHPRQYRPHK